MLLLAAKKMNKKIKKSLYSNSKTPSIPFKQKYNKYEAEKGPLRRQSLPVIRSCACSQACPLISMDLPHTHPLRSTQVPTHTHTTPLTKLLSQFLFVSLRLWAKAASQRKDRRMIRRKKTINNTFEQRVRTFFHTYVPHLFPPPPNLLLQFSSLSAPDNLRRQKKGRQVAVPADDWYFRALLPECVPALPIPPPPPPL